MEGIFYEDHARKLNMQTSVVHKVFKSGVGEMGLLLCPFGTAW
jgi:hypothetical protein